MKNGMTFKEYKKYWEDAAANAVAHGGVAMPADMMPKDKHKNLNQISIIQYTFCECLEDKYC